MFDQGGKRRWILLGLLVAGLLLRVGLAASTLSVDDDTAVYQELGDNLLHHGVYGLAADGVIEPSLIRLPGYPLFLSILGGKMGLIKAVQGFFDLLGCWLLARFLWVWHSEQAGDVALALGCLCIFTASYAETGLTESLSVFAVAWGIWAVGQMMLKKRPGWYEVLPVAGAGALAMLLRPDGALLCAGLLFAVVWYGGWHFGLKKALRLACAVGLLAVLPLVPWTMRNWNTFHVFQPLAPRHVNDPGERVNLGFYHWLRTWSAEYADTGAVFWQVGEGEIDVDSLPGRAFNNDAERVETAAILEAYNEDHTVTPELDARFDRLAVAREKANPLEYWVWVPALRVADMWLRPRTEIFDIDVYWWRFREHPLDSALAVVLGLVNLGYVVLAVLGVERRVVPFARWMLLYMVVRSVMLATLENPEPRYTLECYPMLIVCAASWVGGRFGGRWKLSLAVEAGESDLTELFAESFPVVEGGGLEGTQAGDVGGQPA